MFSAIVTAALVEGLAVGKRYTAPILKIAAIMTKHRKVNIMAKSIFPSLPFCSIAETEVTMAKNTKGITVTKSKLRKISPTGLR